MAFSSAIVQLAAATGGGNQSFTKSGFGTPTAAIFLCTKGTANGTAVDGLGMSIGFTDGANHRLIASQDEHNTGTQDNDRRSETDEVVQIINADGTIDGEANFNAWVTDGVQITWGNAPASAYLITCLLIKCDGADVGDFAAADTNGNTTDVAVSGGEPDVIFFMGNGKVFPGSSTKARVAFGFAVNKATIEGGCTGFAARNGASTARNNGWSKTDRSCCVLAGSSDVLYHAIEVTAFNPGPTPSAGFTTTTRDGTDVFVYYYAYLALFTGATLGLAVDPVDGPSATGNNAQTGPGFKPQLVVTCGANHTAYDSVDGTGLATGFFISLATAAEEFCVSVATEDGVGTMNTQSLTDSKAINNTLDDGTAEHVAAFVSMDTTGYTYNFSTAGTLRKWHAFAIEEEAAAAGGIRNPMGGPTTLRNPLGMQ